MDAPLMEFVEDDHGRAFEARVGLDAAGEDALGNDLDPGLFRSLRIEAYGVADCFARLLAQRFRHPARSGNSGDPSRFEHDDAALSLREQVEQGERDPRGLSRSGRRMEYDRGVAVHGL